VAAAFFGKFLGGSTTAGTGFSFLGKGLPGAFTAAAFLAGTGAAFLTGLAGAFFTGLAGAFLAGAFLAGAFLAGAFFAALAGAFFTGLVGAFFTGLAGAFFTAFFTGLAALVGLLCLFVPMAAQVSPVWANEPLPAVRLARLPPMLALTSVKRVD
jgi:hypothetical protein